MPLKNIANTGQDAILSVVDDLVSLFAAIAPHLPAEAQAAMGEIEIGDELAHVLVPLLTPPAPKPDPAPAAAQQAAAPAPRKSLADMVADAMAAGKLAAKS